MLFATANCATSPEPSYGIVTIGPLTYRVELARTAEQQRKGLDGRQTLPSGTGMLFPFGGSREQQVWMAGMTVPLDIAWIKDEKVAATATLTPCAEADKDRCPRWTSPSAVDALLEVPGGSLATIVPGMPVTVEELP